MSDERIASYEEGREFLLQKITETLPNYPELRDALRQLEGSSQYMNHQAMTPDEITDWVIADLQQIGTWNELLENLPQKDAEERKEVDLVNLLSAYAPIPYE
jgi:hypothetical protein